MVLMAIGVNHKTAPLPVREKFSVNGDMLQPLLRTIISHKAAKEALLLSTCNRTELYCSAIDAMPVLHSFAEGLKLTPTELLPFSYSYVDQSAVQHLMRVACGLNSLVIGEVEILGQIKSAFRSALGAGTIGKYLGRLFQTTFSVAKQVRTETSISVNPVSVASQAVRLAERIFTDLKQSTILLIGAGDLIRLTAMHLKRIKHSRIIIANRSKSRREALGVLCGAETIGLEQIPQGLNEADIVITGTSSILPIIGKGMVERVLKMRRRRPILMVDLAVPRDIEPEVGALEDVYLYCIDDLENIVKENQKSREKAIDAAEHIIDKQSQNFMQWLQAQTSFATLKAFREKFEMEGSLVLSSAVHQLKLGKSPEIVVQRAIHSMLNRVLHTPTRRLRQAGFLGEEQVLKMTRELFELDHEIIDS